MNQPDLPKRANERPREHILSTLGRMILSGEFEPGRRLPTETELGERMAVSRTALREAMRILAGKGLVESRPRVGTVVLPRSRWNQLDADLLSWRESLPPDFAFVQALVEAREVIEPAAAELAAQRASGGDLGRMQAALDGMRSSSPADIEASIAADEAFHQAILMASQNAVFANFGAVIGSALRISFRLTTSASDNFAASVEKHGEVLEAIRMRDVDGARRVMAELIAVANADLSRAIERSGQT